jgi:hypothetical protein
MKPLVSARHAFETPLIFGTELAGESWAAMKAIILAALGEALTEEERAYFQKLTKLDRESLKRVKRLVIVAGRRSGKSKIAAILALYLALLCDHSENLSTGERGVVLCIAQNMEQAKIVFGYVTGIVKSIPTLGKEVANITAQSITFRNRIEIQVRPASFRGLRGVTCIAAICDEMAFWFTEENNSTNPDTEIVNALKPALVTTKGMLIIISSPYARRGVVWKYYSRYFGYEGSTLVAQGASLDFNPTIDPAEIEEDLQEDYAVAQSEWLGQFRTDIESFVSFEAVQGCVNAGVYEIAPELGTTYSCFIDASTGAGGDSFAMAIGHLREAGGDVLVVDCIRNFKPKFSPEEVVGEIAAICHAYQIGIVYSDKYASGFVSELFNRAGLQHDFVTQNKSELYLNLLGSINARKIELLDDKQSIQELINLERRTGFAGKDRIDHPPGCHDDSANCIAGLSAIVREDLGNLDMIFRMWGLKPTLYEERAMRKAREEQRAKEAVAAIAEHDSTSDDQHSDNQHSTDPPLTIDDSKQLPTPDHRAPCDVRILQQ